MYPDLQLGPSWRGAHAKNLALLPRLLGSALPTAWISRVDQSVKNTRRPEPSSPAAWRSRDRGCGTSRGLCLGNLLPYLFCRSPPSADTKSLSSQARPYTARWLTMLFSALHSENNISGTRMKKVNENKFSCMIFKSHK